MARMIVIAGGPGSGKSMLVAALRARGFATAGEAGRAILRQQAAIGGPAGHTADAALYAELMLSWDMRSYDELRDEEGDVFFDRSVAELTGYFALIGRTAPAHFARAAEVCRYHREVFIAPPWREIFTQDAEREQDFAEAVRSHAVLVEAYQAHGYRLVELPCVGVEARVAFVLRVLSAAG